ncbi:hypothetical protein KCU81_g609, partial [Aureobasidium melanogenum]
MLITTDTLLATDVIYSDLVGVENINFNVAMLCRAMHLLSIAVAASEKRMSAKLTPLTELDAMPLGFCSIPQNPAVVLIFINLAFEPLPQTKLSPTNNSFPPKNSFFAQRTEEADSCTRPNSSTFCPALVYRFLLESRRPEFACHQRGRLQELYPEGRHNQHKSAVISSSFSDLFNQRTRTPSEDPRSSTDLTKPVFQSLEEAVESVPAYIASACSERQSPAQDKRSGRRKTVAVGDLSRMRTANNNNILYIGKMRHDCDRFLQQ